jgi:hypothetical protein
MPSNEEELEINSIKLSFKIAKLSAEPPVAFNTEVKSSIDKLVSSTIVYKS